ncbi:RHS repeat domain-containing protein [Pseudomonas sp. PDM32]|uniref:RHS repeat domain-containing protein n=1 Tax=Pseudomonas sp. PDM32 TaxID=2854768 RepID=UPI00210E7C62|nr:RHS repeat-associated core domain-containing protein [Pseudomonas sp. PDM32]
MPLDYVHSGTSTLAVIDPRALALRAVQFHRRQATDPAEARVTHQRFNAAGRPVASRDPYLFALAQNDVSVPVNLSQVFSLSGVPLASDSVDAGWRVALHGAAGQIVERWDGRGSCTLTEFDALLRPVAVRERGDDSAELVVERFTYAGVDADTAVHNLCGQLIRHDDPAGTLHLKELGLGGAVLQQTRHFLRDADTPDWPASEAARDALLETGDGATTSHVYSPGAEPLQQTDALGNRQRFAYTVAGQLKNTRLTLVGEDEITLVSALHYNASGQIESETAGNRVITRHRYDLADGRLIGLSAHKADGTPLQDLSYSYDAVGNVLSLEDAAQPIRYFNNQRIEPLKTYRYDTLDQLIEARGWEAKTGHGGPALPDLQPLPPDPNQIANYTQTYHYDAGGNLLDLVHVGAQAPGRLLTRAKYSNRCLPERNGRPPTEAEIAAGFDANGNLRELQAGQVMEWDLRNQLTVVRPVVREEAEDDYERYVYDGGGQRVRKLRANQTNARTLISEVRYLPGVEIRSHGGTGEILHVITASAGSNSVQVLHWVAGQPKDIANNQVRYSLNDHLQSSALELDQNADLISQEWYYPFGGTACFAARSDTEAKYKTVRYSGKERDATGLYYYGFRYYVPWLQRWINPDPAGNVDGMNLFRMVKNNPITYFDKKGKIPENFNPQQYLENFKYVMKEDLNRNHFFYRDANRQAVSYYLEELENFENLSTSQDQWNFQATIQNLTEKLFPRSAESRIFYAHRKAFIRLHDILTTAKNFHSFDEIPVPPLNPDPRHGSTNRSGFTYRSENPQSSEKPHHGARSEGARHSRSSRRSRTEQSFATIHPLTLPQGTDSVIVEGYQLAIKIINNQKNLDDIFPTKDAAEKRITYLQVVRLIHPDKLTLDGTPEVAAAATQAFQLFSNWSSPQDHRTRSPSPAARSGPPSPPPDY